MSGSPQVRRADKLMTEERARETLERGFCGRLATLVRTLALLRAAPLRLHGRRSLRAQHARARPPARECRSRARVCFEIDEAGEVSPTAASNAILLSNTVA